MAHLLAIESAGAACSVAVLRRMAGAPDTILAYRALPAARGQADRLIELIEAVLDEARVGYGELELIALDRGPGSFTGVRTAVAAARGLALAAGLPVLPLSSLECLAAAARPRAGAGVLAALDARRGEVYAQVFDARRRPQAEPFAAPPERMAKELSGAWHLIGSGAALIRAALPADVDAVVESARLDARLVAEAAARSLDRGARPIRGFDLDPLYLRAPDARPRTPPFATPATAP